MKFVLIKYFNKNDFLMLLKNIIIKKIRNYTSSVRYYVNKLSYYTHHHGGSTITSESRNSS